MSRIVVGMSGGVDSSVTAALLKKQGHDVIGVTMKLWAGEAAASTGKRHGCYGPGDGEEIAEAKKVAQTIGIPLHVMDLSTEYRTEVLDYFCEQYLAGKTPNPCVRCNHRIKFGGLVKKVTESGIEFDFFATGHYARVEFDKDNSRYLLKKARDLKKDQTYFLSALTQAQLSRTLFPLGNLTKDEVRKLSRDFGLDMDEKPESQDFAEGGYGHLFGGKAKPGQIVDIKGNVVGRHRGIQFYTIGQRKGLGIAAKKPLYAVALDAAKNQVIVGEKQDTLSTAFIVSGVNWISIPALSEPRRARVRIRYLHPEAEALLQPLGDDRMKVEFSEPQSAIAPGQEAVFYDGEVVLGGGTIE